MSDVVQKLWGFCHTLRHDGIDYGDYIEQITFLLFLKMADEKGIDVPRGCDWPTLRDESDSRLTDLYANLLRKLGKTEGILGDIYAEAQSRFNNPVSLTCYGDDPNGRSKRKEGQSPAGRGYLDGDRWRCFSLAEVEVRDFKLDSFKWLKDDSLEDADELPPPEELATDAISELEGAVEELNAALVLLENGNGNGNGANGTQKKREARASLLQIRTTMRSGHP